MKVGAHLHRAPSSFRPNWSPITIRILLAKLPEASRQLVSPDQQPH
jgi:hypothetical protein